MFVEEVNQINDLILVFFFLKSLIGPTHFISSTPILNFYSWNPYIPIILSISYSRQSSLNEPKILNQPLINIDNFTYQNNSITIPNLNVVEGNSILSVHDNNDHNEVQFMPKGLTSHERSHLNKLHKLLNIHKK
jgi:hypothetical protein